MYLQSYHSTKTAKLELRAKRKDLLLDFGTGRLAFGHLRYTKKAKSPIRCMSSSSSPARHYCLWNWKDGQGVASWEGRGYWVLGTGYH